jgi:hypothetical protein
MGAGASVTGQDLDVGPVDKTKAGGRSSTIEEGKSTVEVGKGLLAAVRFFTVSLHTWAKNSIPLPNSFQLRISLESLDFVTADAAKTPWVQFPFQNILCWGSSSKVFQFSIFDVENCMVGKSPDTIPIYLRTNEGKEIEKWIMENVRRLMADMEKPHAVTKEEYRGLKSLLFQIERSSSSNDAEEEHEDGSDPPPSPDAEALRDACLRDDWFHVIDQFSTGRLFLAKQGMELMLIIGPHQPFEKFDLALLLYDRILNPESFQLIINTFEDEAERENLILRLAQDKKDKEARRGGLHSATKIMKEYVASPGSSHRKAVDSHSGAGAGSDDTCSRPALEHASASDARSFEEEPLRPRRLDAGNEEDEEKESPRS